MLKKLLPVACLGLILAACGIGQSSSRPSGIPVGAERLCDTTASTSLEGLSTQFDGFGETTDTAALLQDSSSTKGELEGLDAGSDEIAQWRDASIDALTQLERRIDDAERLPEVVRHAARTLRGLGSRLCS